MFLTATYKKILVVGNQSRSILVLFERGTHEVDDKYLKLALQSYDQYLPLMQIFENYHLNFRKNDPAHVLPSPEFL